MLSVLYSECCYPSGCYIFQGFMGSVVDRIDGFPLRFLHRHVQTISGENDQHKSDHTGCRRASGDYEK